MYFINTNIKNNIKFYKLNKYKYLHIFILNYNYV